MLRHHLVLLAVLSAALIFAACGDDDDSTPTPTGDASASAGPTTTENAGPLGPNGRELSTAGITFTIETADRGDFAPLSTGLASGDFNADGQPDLAVGASYAAGPQNDRAETGEVYVLFDTTALTGTTVLSPETAGFILYGVEGEEFHGFQIAAADLNGDSTDDLILTAPGITAGRDLRTDQGRVYVFFGGSNFGRTIDLAGGSEPWDFVLTGAEGFSRAGHTIDIGDINGDAADDLIVGAPFAGREPGSPPGGPRLAGGAVYVIYGRSDLAGEVNIAFDAPDFWITNEGEGEVNEFSQFASSVVAGDFNGDGTDDIAIGAPQFDPEIGADSGSVFVFYGGSALPAIINSTEADVIVRPADEGDALGYQVDVLATDEGPDLLIASASRGAGPDNARPAAGDVYVIDASAAGVIDLSQTEPQAVIYGAAQGMSIGQEIAVGDVDGDGAEDIALSGPSAASHSGTLANAGMTMVVFGPDFSGAIDGGDQVIWYEGSESDGASGSPLFISDPDSDGQNSLLIGASRSGASGERPGRIFAITVAR